MTAPRRVNGGDGPTVVLALPKGRILSDILPLLGRAGIEIEAAFADEESRKLSFATSIAALSVVRVRSFDVATYVAFGAAHLGIAGSDVIGEFDYPDVYVPVDLQVSHCRLSVAEPLELAERDDPSRWSQVRVATKYPRTTARHFASRGVHAECVVLSGAMELAPQLGLCTRIVDLVATGATLRANRLAEVERIADVTARLIVNRTALKLQPDAIGALIEAIREAASAG
jgi:ATP phosphoribosyltransferase